MDWKEFLKPDLRKMLLLLILIGILFLIPITTITESTCNCIDNFPCDCLESKDIIETSLGMETIGMQISPSNAIIVIPIIVVELFLLYLLACILSSVYDKFKVKK